MSSEARASMFFCEDYRVEIGDKPMILGLLAPVVFTDAAGPSEDDVVLVTLVHAPFEVESVELKLTITHMAPGHEDASETFRKVLERPPESRANSEWSAFLPLRTSDRYRGDGSRVTAELCYGDKATRAELLMRCEAPTSSEAAWGGEAPAPV